MSAAILSTIVDKLVLAADRELATAIGSNPEDARRHVHRSDALLEAVRIVKAEREKYRSGQPAWLCEALNEGNGVYRP